MQKVSKNVPKTPNPWNSCWHTALLYTFVSCELFLFTMSDPAYLWVCDRFSVDLVFLLSWSWKHFALARVTRTLHKIRLWAKFVLMIWTTTKWSSLPLIQHPLVFLLDTYVRTLNPQFQGNVVAFVAGSSKNNPETVNTQVVKLSSQFQINTS